MKDNSQAYKVTFLVAQEITLTGDSLGSIEAECKASLLANYGLGNFVLHSIERVKDVTAIQELNNNV